LATEIYSIKTVCLAWWVSANKKLKDFISIEAEKKGIQFHSPIKPIYSQDNAAMIGIRAYYEIVSGRVDN
jgi:tRNA A37 threonylcarbamoyltransferase TsaD